MNSYHRGVASMRAMLLDEASVESLALAWAQPVERVAIYRTMVAAHSRTAIEKNYRSMPALFSPARWDELVTGYYAQHRPWCFELNENAAQFPEYLEHLRSAGASDISVAHVELARLEWAEWNAFSTAVEIPNSVALPALNPTLHILENQYPVAAFLSACHEDDSLALPDTPAPEICFVFRSPRSELHQTLVADPELLLAFKIVHDGLEFGTAARLAGISIDDLVAVLARAQRLGLVLLPNG
jgi:hypothetical protein